MTHLPPEAELVVEGGKMTDYLLNTEHPIGKAKAKFFLARGFSTSNLEQFAAALEEHGRKRPIIKETPTDFGTKYQIECEIASVTGPARCVRSIWIKEEDERYRLVTAHPLD